MNKKHNYHITVMMSPGETTEKGNPFVKMLIDSLSDSVEVIPFGWSSAFLSRYNVLHVHWPDRMTQGDRRWRRFFKQLAFLLLIFRNTTLRVAHVATVHNLEPHEGTGTLERWVLGLWSRSCSAQIFLSKSGLNSSPTEKGHVILHGDYSPYIDSFATLESNFCKNSVLTFGYLRPYKNIEKLIGEFISEAELKLTIAGKPISKQYGDTLCDLAGDIKKTGINLIAQSLDDAELIAAILVNEFILLPYKKIYNSGAVILALTLGRPVVVSSSPSMQELQSEVGEEWLYILPSNWTISDIHQIVVKIRMNQSLRLARPVLPGREWSSIAEQHVAVYNDSLRSQYRKLRLPRFRRSS